MIITIVSDTPDVEAVLFGGDGVFEGISSGNVVVDMSTISPAATESFAARLAERGGHMLDAPVSGGDKGAIAGTLSIMVGGSDDAFAKAKPLFDAMGKNVVHVGGNGDGQRTKACNQIAGALHVVAMSEALNLARAAGLDGEKVLAAISQGAAGSWMLSNLAPRALKNDFDPGFMIKLQAKDLRLAAEEIERLGIEAEGTLLAKTLFDRANEMGMGELGTQGLYKLYIEQGV
jgi:3-hydroxyisobutyrate dehydrogenase